MCTVSRFLFCGVQNVRVLNRYDAEGIDLAAVKEIKEVKRARLTEYKKYRPNSEYHEGKGVWTVPCDVALRAQRRTS